MIDSKKFWVRVKGYGVDGVPCWRWKGYKRADGYGVLRHQKKLELVHRIAWQLTYGAIPPGLFVCHHCDVRDCCNPYHLFLGTAEDNARDMAAKGRHALQRHPENNPMLRYPERRPKGTKHGMAVLTELQVCGIMARHLMGISNREIAIEFNTSPQQVSHITNGHTWQHLFE